MYWNYLSAVDYFTFIEKCQEKSHKRSYYKQFVGKNLLYILQ